MSIEHFIVPALGLCGGAAGWFASYWGFKMYNARVLKRNAWQRWLFRAEEDAVALIHASTEAAVRKQSMADLVMEVPEPFEGAVMELARFGYTFELAALHEAAQRGAYHLCDPAYYRPPKPTGEAAGASCEPVIVVMAEPEAPRLPAQGTASMPPPPMLSAGRLSAEVWSDSVGAFVPRR